MLINEGYTDQAIITCSTVTEDGQQEVIAILSDQVEQFVKHNRISVNNYWKERQKAVIILRKVLV